MLKIISQTWPPRPPAVDPDWDASEKKLRYQRDRGLAHVFGVEPSKVSKPKQWNLATFMEELRSALTKLPITFMNQIGPKDDPSTPNQQIGSLVYHSTQIGKFTIGIALDYNGFAVFVQDVYSVGDVPLSHADKLIERIVKELKSRV